MDRLRCGRKREVCGSAWPLLATLFSFVLQSQAQPCAPEWAGGFDQKGFDGIVRAFAVFDDGAGPALYAGGQFSTAGGIPASRIARWNGDTSTWSSLGSGMDDTVWALAVFDDGSGAALYAGGSFTTAGGIPTHRIAKWNGSTWSAVGGGMQEDYSGVYALMVYDYGAGSALYAGGHFSNAAGQPVNHIAKWDGQSWSALDSGVSGSFPIVFPMVRSLAVFDDGTGASLYVGGYFNSPGSHIAKWNGSSWSTLGSGASNIVNALAVYDDGGGSALYAGGAFTTAGGIVGARRIARWDGSAWSALGAGLLSEPVNALAVFDDTSGPALYVAGEFTETSGTGIEVRRIARWNGSAWSTLETGIPDDDSDPCWCSGDCDCPPRPGVVHALVPFNEALYVGGDFVNASFVYEDLECFPSNFIAKWACPPSVLVSPDFDRDGDVDAHDFTYFEACFTGPSVGPPTVCCTVTDWDNDDDVDQSDFGMFQRCYSGENNLPDPNCAD